MDLSPDRDSFGGQSRDFTELQCSHLRARNAASAGSGRGVEAPQAESACCTAAIPHVQHFTRDLLGHLNSLTTSVMVPAQSPAMEVERTLISHRKQLLLPPDAELRPPRKERKERGELESRG